MPSPQTSTIVIKHPVAVTKEYLLGQETGFPAGDHYLCPPVVRHAVMCLVGRDVQRFDDGLYHAEIHTFGMHDILNDLSAHDAAERVQHLETKADSGKKLIVYAGVRWEISNKPREVRIFGPKSDPDNQVVIDLLKKEEDAHG